MSDLRRQIKNQLHLLYANSALPTLVTGMYYGRTPAGVTQDDYPLIVYQITRSRTEFVLGSLVPRFEDVLVEFKIVSAKSASTEAENICETLVGVYDGASLALAGWTLLEMVREEVFGPYLDDVGVWNLNVVYRITCQR